MKRNKKKKDRKGIEEGERRTSIGSVAARLIRRIGGDDDGGGGARGAAPVVEVLGVAGGVVAERDGPARGRRRGAADAPGLLRQPPEQLPPRALPAPPDVARQDELRAADHGGRAAVLA